MSPWSPLFLLLLELSWALDTPEKCKTIDYLTAPEGGSVNITCSMKDFQGVYLKRRYPKYRNVSNIFYYDSRGSTVDSSFKDRVSYSFSTNHILTITLLDLSLCDTGIFFCQIVQVTQEVPGPETYVIVTAVQEAWMASVTFPVILAVVCFLFGLGLGTLCMLRRTQIKSLCWKQDKASVCVVYEDMSCSRRNTMSTPMSTPNQYI